MKTEDATELARRIKGAIRRCKPNGTLLDECHATNLKLVDSNLAGVTEANAAGLHAHAARYGTQLIYIANTYDVPFKAEEAESEFTDAFKKLWMDSMRDVLPTSVTDEQLEALWKAARKIGKKIKKQMS